MMFVHTSVLVTFRRFGPRKNSVYLSWKRTVGKSESQNYSYIELSIFDLELMQYNNLQTKKKQFKSTLIVTKSLPNSKLIKHMV